MKFSISFVMFFVVTSSVSSGPNNEVIDYYQSLMKNTHPRYKATGVIVSSMNNGNHHKLDNSTFWHELSRILSTEGISSTIISFAQLEERLNFHIEQGARPLVVIGIASMERLYNFTEIAKDLPLSYFRWIIFFGGEENSETIKFCRDPRGNLLNLKFNSEVLISCGALSIIEEWWSRNGNDTDKRPLGKWNNESRSIEWFPEDGLYTHRFPPEGLSFRIATFERSSYYFEENGERFGYLVALLDELSRSINFTVSSSTTASSPGNFNETTSEWSGVIGLIKRRKADIGVAAMSMTNERLDVVDFTHPIGSGECRLYFKKDNIFNVQWRAYFQVFRSDVWTAIISFILITPVVLILIKYTERMNQWFSVAIEHYLYIWGIYCQQGLSEVPRKTPLRIIYVSIFISAWIISAAYSGALISFLTVSPTYSAFNTIGEFINDGTYKLVVVKDSADYDLLKASKESAMKSMMSVMKSNELPLSTKEAFAQVCSERVAFYGNEPERRAVGSFIPCEISSVRIGGIRAVGMILPLHSEYTDLLNYHIQRFQSNGMINRLEQIYFADRDPIEPAHSHVHLRQIAPILCVLTGGYLIALIILLIERIYFRGRIKLHNRTKEKLIQKHRFDLLQRGLVFRPARRVSQN